MSDYDIKQDYSSLLREFILHSWSIPVYEDPDLYFNAFDPNMLQGFLVWNVDAYLAKEYDYLGTEARVDFFVIPAFGGSTEHGCEGTWNFGINVDFHKDVDQTGERLTYVLSTIKNWHLSQIALSIWPKDIGNMRYMIMADGKTPQRTLVDQPYIRQTGLYRMEFLQRLPS